MHKSSIKTLLAALVVMAVLPQPLLAEEIDGVKVYYHDGITVSAKRDLIPWSEFRVEKGNVSDVLDRNGFSVIRKGVFLAQDIYADGMKKSDISVVIDDERYQCACPNCMDAPVSRIAPLDIESVELDKSAASFMCSEDVSFPYLKMDERNSKVYNASVARGDVKLSMNKR